MRAIVAVIRITIFATWSVFCIFLSLFSSLLLLSKKPTIFFAKHLWSPVALFIMGAKLKVIGRENIQEKHSYVVMGNHCSYLDIPALFLAMPFHLHFIAKKELKRMPFLGWYLVLSDMILIDRKNTAKAKESLAEAVKLVNKGKHVVIFPEGTASKNGKMAPFKKGGFFMAEDAEAHIVPTHIKGSYEVFPSSKKLNMQRGTITVCIGKPISPEEYKKFEMDDRVDYVKQLMQNL